MIECIGMAGVSMMLLNAQTYVYTSGTEAVTKPLTNLKTLVISVIGAVGVIILAKNVMEFAQAYQQQDSSTMNFALNGRSTIRTHHIYIYIYACTVI